MLKLPNWLFKRLEFLRPEPKDSDGVTQGRWCIQQFCTCPFCDHEFDIIQENLRRGRCQGTIRVTQKVVQKYDKNKFDYNEITAEVPVPPYFGAMMEDTENLDEHIECPKCRRDITINETRWGYGR